MLVSSDLQQLFARMSPALSEESHCIFICPPCLTSAPHACVTQLSDTTLPFACCLVNAVGMLSTCLVLHALKSLPCHHLAVAVAVHMCLCHLTCLTPVTVQEARESEACVCEACNCGDAEMCPAINRDSDTWAYTLLETGSYAKAEANDAPTGLACPSTSKCPFISAGSTCNHAQGDE